MELNPIIARLLSARGIEPDDYEEFFDPSLARLAPPCSLPGVSEAVDVILSHVGNGREIVVFGDYDADGVCASAILVTTLQRFGARVSAFIPHRFKEGYGMTSASIARLTEEHPDVSLVITVDNGISSPAEVADLRGKGISVVVTDHHLPGAEIPAADALVNPRVASAPGCEELCGAGVAFFLAAALVAEATARGTYAGAKFGGPILILAGLATVADLMPLTGQNRILASEALRKFRRFAPLGLSELVAHAARRATDVITARDFAFLLAPRINAAGRVASAMEAYELLMATDRETARRLAVAVDSRNGERKGEETRMHEEARAQIPSPVPAAVVVSNDEWNSGVAGIVAARIMEEVRVPVAVVTEDHGSARAPGGYNVRDALAAASDALARFGGHAAAGGFTVLPGRLDDFREKFTAACAAQRAANAAAVEAALDPEPEAWLEPADLTIDFYNQLKMLEPFGEGNPEPVFGIRDVAPTDIKLLGLDGRHIAFSFSNRAIPRAVWWNNGSRADELRAHSAARFDILFTLMVSAFGESEHLELRLTDMRPHRFAVQ
jgi:single-stranded-DNA-specific exonuclease